MGEALPPNIQELVNRQITYMANKPINFAEIEEEWQTTNPEGEALPSTIQDIVAQRIANSSTSEKINFSYYILLHLITSYSSYFGGKKGISGNKTSFFLLMKFI